MKAQNYACSYVNFPFIAYFFPHYIIMIKGLSSMCFWLVLHQLSCIYVYHTALLCKCSLQTEQKLLESKLQLLSESCRKKNAKASLTKLHGYVPDP